jgi:ketosteroid isomerase-like protein
MRSRIVAALLVSFASIAGSQAPPPAPSTKALRESLLNADRQLSASTKKIGLRAAFADALADDAYFLYEGVPVVSGKSNIVGMLSSQDALDAMRVEWFPLVVTTSRDGTLGATWGVTTILSAPNDTTTPRHGKYISMWRRSADGAWQIVGHVDMGLTDAKVIVPASVTVSHFDPLKGSGAAFAQADIDFSRMAGASGAPRSFGAFAASDAMTLPGTGEIVVGPAAIEARMTESPAAQAKWEWHPVYSEGAASGDLGFTVGEAVITPPGATPDKAFHSKYLTVWRRQPDGSIRYIVDGGNSR